MFATTEDDELRAAFERAGMNTDEAEQAVERTRAEARRYERAAESMAAAEQERDRRTLIDAAARGEAVDEDLGSLVLVDEASNRGAYRVRVVLEGFVYVDEPTWIDPAKVREEVAASAKYAVDVAERPPAVRAVSARVEPATMRDLVGKGGNSGGHLRCSPFDPGKRWGAWQLGDLLAGYHRELPPARPSTLPELGRWILDPRQGERTRSGAHGWVLRTSQRADNRYQDRADVLFTNGQSALEVRGVDGEAVGDILPPVVGQRRDGDDEPGLDFEVVASAVVSTEDLRELVLDGDHVLAEHDIRRPYGDDGGHRVGLRFYEHSAEVRVCARALGLWAVAPAEVAGDERVLVEVLVRPDVHLPGRQPAEQSALVRFTGSGWRSWLRNRPAFARTSYAPTTPTRFDGPSLVVSEASPPPGSIENGGRR